MRRVWSTRPSVRAAHAQPEACASRVQPTERATCERPAARASCRGEGGGALDKIDMRSMCATRSARLLHNTCRAGCPHATSSSHLPHMTSRACLPHATISAWRLQRQGGDAVDRINRWGWPTTPAGEAGRMIGRGRGQEQMGKVAPSVVGDTPGRS